MSIWLIFPVWGNCVGQHYQVHLEQTDWTNSCRSETYLNLAKKIFFFFFFNDKTEYIQAVS